MSALSWLVNTTVRMSNMSHSTISMKTLSRTTKSWSTNTHNCHNIPFSPLPNLQNSLTRSVIVSPKSSSSRANSPYANNSMCLLFRDQTYSSINCRKHSCSSWNSHSKYNSCRSSEHKLKLKSQDLLAHVSS